MRMEINLGFVTVFYKNGYMTGQLVEDFVQCNAEDLSVKIKSFYNL